MASTEYTPTAFSPSSHDTLSRPKKFQLRMVEKAKNSRHSATNILPARLPSTVPKASCAMLALLTPSAAPAERMPFPAYRVEITTSAVMVSTTKVSMNTPVMATTPCSWGCFTLAMAWA